ncbi:conserved hypothetical protein [Ricinus communis]|uniref:Uncharacterized protein n=1 Tax=Ricinus communis TaxID=3988 RepID=B9SWF4_RICCO|nr:conserved hypothetical protein [Ricinus communis]
MEAPRPPYAPLPLFLRCQCYQFCKMILEVMLIRAVDIPAVIPDSDEEESGYKGRSHLYQADALSEAVQEISMEEEHVLMQYPEDDDGLAIIWEEMAFALEYSKFYAAISRTLLQILPLNESMQVDEEECDHSFFLKDDPGYVCCVCGVIQNSSNIICEFQHS